MLLVSGNIKSINALLKGCHKNIKLFFLVLSNPLYMKSKKLA